MKRILLIFMLFVSLLSCEGQVPSIGGCVPSTHFNSSASIFDRYTLTAVDSININTVFGITLGTGLSISDDSNYLYLTENISGTDSIYQFEFAEPGSISTISQIYSTTNNPEGYHKDVFVSDGGSSVYFIGSGYDDIRYSTLSTPYDLSTKAYVNNFSLKTQLSGPRGFCFNHDGTELYAVGTATTSIHQYTLTTAWSLSTASYSKVYSYTNENPSSAMDVQISDDGSSVIILAYTGYMYKYNLSTLFDISSCSFDHVVEGILRTGYTSENFTFSSDRSTIYILYSSGYIVQYE